MNEGKIRKSKALPPISEDEVPFEAPGGVGVGTPRKPTSASQRADTKFRAATVLEAGAVPVVDQGQSAVAGYTNDDRQLISPVEACVAIRRSSLAP